MRCDLWLGAGNWWSRRNPTVTRLPTRWIRWLWRQAALMPTRQLDQAERAEMVRDAIQSLSERQKMALLLSKFEGMSYAEIAETMQLSTQAVKSLLSRARCNLAHVA